MGKLIGIGGVSRAGKTSLAHFLQTQLSGCSILHQDEFVKDPDQIPVIQNRVDWEHPDSIDWEKWKNAVMQSLEKNEYTIVDGLFAFNRDDLNELMDSKIYLSINKSRFHEAKKADERWGKEPDWFIEHIWNAHNKFANTAHLTDLLHLHNISPEDYPKALRKVR